MLGMEDVISELEDSFAADDQGLPPGFRFHPTDEELITFYLASKVFNNSILNSTTAAAAATFSSFAGVHIAEVDLNRCEPWDLPERAKMGEREWYFYSLRDRKYPTGLRTNRATGAGYWKATGKDREVYGGYNGEAPLLLGMKKTLVFYKGRAPRGLKTRWVMHEYRLDGHFSYRHSCKEEWVICRIFHKRGDKKCSIFQGQNYPSAHHQPPSSPLLANSLHQPPPLPGQEPPPLPPLTLPNAQSHIPLQESDIKSLLNHFVFPSQMNAFQLQAPVASPPLTSTSTTTTISTAMNRSTDVVNHQHHNNLSPSIGFKSLLSHHDHYYPNDKEQPDGQQPQAAVGLQSQLAAAAAAAIPKQCKSDTDFHLFQPPLLPPHHHHHHQRSLNTTSIVTLPSNWLDKICQAAPPTSLLSPPPLPPSSHPRYPMNFGSDHNSLFGFAPDMSFPMATYSKAATAGGCLPLPGLMAASDPYPSPGAS